MAIILASQSPRRRQLLEQMGMTEFQICPAQGEEVMDPALNPGELVERLSRAKALEVAAQAKPGGSGHCRRHRGGLGGPGAGQAPG